MNWKNVIVIVAAALLPISMIGQANILNAKKPQDIGKRTEAQKAMDHDAPLEYGYVDDRDILWSKTVWEVIDLDERIPCAGSSNRQRNEPTVLVEPAPSSSWHRPDRARPSAAPLSVRSAMPPPPKSPPGPGPRRPGSARWPRRRHHSPESALTRPNTGALACQAGRTRIGRGVPRRPWRTVRCPPRLVSREPPTPLWQSARFVDAHVGVDLNHAREKERQATDLRAQRLGAEPIAIEAPGEWFGPETKLAVQDRTGPRVQRGDRRVRHVRHVQPLATGLVGHDLHPLQELTQLHHVHDWLQCAGVVAIGGAGNVIEDDSKVRVRRSRSRPRHPDQEAVSGST